MKVIIFDTETTGLVENESLPLTAQPRIIELGAMKVDTDSWEMLDKLSVLIDPEMDIPPIITKITGITTKDVKGQKLFAEVFPTLANFFTGAEALVAHNLPFDKALLKFELMRMGREFSFPWPWRQLCTVEQTLHLKGHRLNLKKLYKLRFGEEPAQTHRALEDVELLLKVFRDLVEKGDLTLD